MPPVSGRRRRLAACGAAAGLALGTVVGAPAAWAQPTTTPAPTGAAGASSLNDEAASLAAQIRQEGRQGDQLSEQANLAQIRVGQIADQLRGVQEALAGTETKLARARSTLGHQAVAAYMQGGRQPLTYVAHDTADDKALINGYASAVAGIQQRDVDSYQILRKQQGDQNQALSVAQSSAVASVEQLRAAQQAAQSIAAQEQRTLDNIRAQPQLTTLVASAETSQYQATASAVQARFTSAGAATAARSAGPAGSSTAVRISSAGASGAGGAPGANGSAGASRLSGHRGTGPVAAANNATPVAVPSASASPAPVVPAPATTTAARPVISTVPAAPTPPRSGVSAAIAYAYAQIGKPYQWGGAGPNSFDCSGLVMRAYAVAGIGFDHSAQDQYNGTARVSITSLQPGDLVFFGTPGNISHDGIYVGGGSMVDAPHAGANVRVEGIYWGDLLAGGRV